MSIRMLGQTSKIRQPCPSYSGALRLSLLSNCGCAGRTPAALPVIQWISQDCGYVHQCLSFFVYPQNCRHMWVKPLPTTALAQGCEIHCPMGRGLTCVFIVLWNPQRFQTYHKSKGHLIKLIVEYLFFVCIFSHFRAGIPN